MLNNKRIQINLKEGNASGFRKTQLRSVNRKLKKSIFGLPCDVCNGDCNAVCWHMLRAYKVNELEIAGGKSDFLASVEVNDMRDGVSMDMYQQLLNELFEAKQELAEYVSSIEAEKKAVEAEKKVAKTTSEPILNEKTGKPSGKNSVFPTILQSAAEVLGASEEAYEPLPF